MGTKISCIASHEGTGVVVATGSEITDSKKGDLVMAGLPRNRCGHCWDCLGNGNHRQYCLNILGHIGVTTDGAFAEYHAGLPKYVSFAEA